MIPRCAARSVVAVAIACGGASACLCQSLSAPERQLRVRPVSSPFSSKPGAAAAIRATWRRRRPVPTISRRRSRPPKIRGSTAASLESAMCWLRRRGSPATPPTERRRTGWWRSWAGARRQAAPVGVGSGTRHRHRERDGCLIFRHQPDATDLYYLSWCHGPAGTARLFYRLHRPTGDPEWAEWMQRLARGVLASGIPETATPGFWNNLGQCCGSAGVAEFFLALHQVTGKPDYLAFAKRMTAQLLGRATVDGTGRRWGPRREPRRARGCRGADRLHAGRCGDRFVAPAARRLRARADRRLRAA